MMPPHPLLEEVDAATVAAALAGEEPPLLVDVRTDAERSAAAIEVTWACGPWRWEWVSLSGSESSRKSKRSCSTM
jgi:hypothetical protein